MGSPKVVSSRGMWGVTLALAGAAFVLGCLGLDEYVRTQPDFDEAGPADVVYYTLQLFVFDPTPFGAGRIPWPLQVARFLAPFTTLLALVQTLALLFGDWAMALYVRSKPGHVIVVGDGHAGALLAERLLHRGEVVAVIGGAVPPENVRGRRMLVLPGEPTDELTLRAAGLGRTSAVYAVSSSWVSNAAVALAVSKCGDPAVRVYAHVDDDVLVAAVRARHLVTTPPARLPEFISLDAVAARVLLDEHPPGQVNGHPRPVVITGAGGFALALLRELGRRQEQAPARRHVSVVTRGPGPAVEPMAASGPAQLHVDMVTQVPDDPDAIVYVCWSDPDWVLRTGLAPRPAGTGRVVLCLQRLAGLGEALNGQRVFDAERITVFGILDTACDPERIEGDLLDQLARAVHAQYLRNRLDRGMPVGSAVVPWEELEPRFREDNRRVAADVQNKLDVIGAELMPLSRAFAPFRFEATEVDDLARREHERWMAAKIAAGFVLGSDRTDTTHPDIRPWEQLDEDARQKDVDIITSLPAVLAQAGLQIVRHRDLRNPSMPDRR